MGQNFRSSNKAPQVESEKKDQKKKKSLQDVCLDLKKATVEKQQEKVSAAKKVEYDADFEALMAQMYGPQIDPKTLLLEHEGQKMSRVQFEEFLMRAYQAKSNRLPVTWETEKDFMALCLKNSWIEMDDSSVYILSKEETIAA